MDKVWCYIPDENVAVQDYRQITQSGFPKIVPSDFEQLQKYYRFGEGPAGRIANRVTQQLNVIPKDSYRYGYSLWADKNTGLLLRSDLINEEDEIVEQYLFVKIIIGGTISDEQLTAVSNKEELQLFSNTIPFSAPVESSDWKVTQIPEGYSLTKHIRRMSPMEAEEVEHMVYTDGLSTVSVFIKKTRKGQSGMSGISRMGAVHAFRKTVNDHSITVLGEVPAAMVKYLAQGVVFNN